QRGGRGCGRTAAAAAVGGAVELDRGHPDGDLRSDEPGRGDPVQRGDHGGERDAGQHRGGQRVGAGAGGRGAGPVADGAVVSEAEERARQVEPAVERVRGGVAGGPCGGRGAVRVADGGDGGGRRRGGGPQ